MQSRRQLRGEMRAVLANLDRRWLAAASRDLGRELSRLLDEEYGTAIEHVLVWVSFFPGEVDLGDFIEREISRRRIYFPRTLPDRSMRFISIEPDWRATAEPGAYGIPEPREDPSRLFDPGVAARTAVIVPGLAFDARGGRLGRGGGYYDRFLGRASMQRAVTIGACWSLQLVDAAPTESHDVIMDWLCHERGYGPAAEFKGVRGGAE